MAMLRKKIKKFASAEKSQGLIFRERIRIRAVVRCRNQNALIGTLVMDGAIQVANCGNTNGIRIAFRLDYDLPSTNGVGIKCNCIDSSVATCLCDFDLASALTELLFKNLSDQILEIKPVHRSQVCSLVNSISHSVALDEPLVFSVEYDQWLDRAKLYQLARRDALKFLKAQLWIDLTKIDREKFVFPSFKAHYTSVDF